MIISLIFQATQLNRHMRCCPVRVADKTINIKPTTTGRSSATTFETLAEGPVSAVSMAMRDVLPTTRTESCDLKVPLVV